MCVIYFLSVRMIFFHFLFRFAQFFISPLLSPSSIDREIQAVNSEFEGDLAQDSWRISQVKRATSDPEHPYSKFTIGNNESLRTIPTQLGIDLREVLLDFYEKQYSANRMSLVVLGNRKYSILFSYFGITTPIVESLDDLQTMVVKSFKDVRNKQLIAQKYPADPFGETRCKVTDTILFLFRSVPSVFFLLYYLDYLLHRTDRGDASYDNDLGDPRLSRTLLLRCR